MCIKPIPEKLVLFSPAVTLSYVVLVLMATQTQYVCRLAHMPRSNTHLVWIFVMQLTKLKKDLFIIPPWLVAAV